MSKKRKDKGPENQHYVARFHLRPWIVDGHILEVDKLSQTVARKGVKRIACDYRFYELNASAESELGKMGKTVEKWSAEEENKAAPIIRKMIGDVDLACETFLNQTNREKLLRYVAFQMLRSPGARLTVGDIRSWRAREIWNDYLKDNLLRPLPWPMSKEDLSFFDDDFAKVQHFGVMMQVNRLANTFCKRFHSTFYFDDLERKQLVISDFPVVGKVEEPQFMMPLSPDTLVHLSFKPREQSIVELKESDIIDFNSLQMQQGRKIYCKPSQVEPVLDAIRSNPDWCSTDEEILERTEKEYQLSAHWLELPGVSHVRVM